MLCLLPIETPSFIHRFWRRSINSNKDSFWPICFYSLESQKSTISTQQHVEFVAAGKKRKLRCEEIKREGKGRSPSLEVQISGDKTENKKL